MARRWSGGTCVLGEKWLSLSWDWLVLNGRTPQQPVLETREAGSQGECEWRSSQGWAQRAVRSALGTGVSQETPASVQAFSASLSWDHIGQVQTILPF